MLGANFTQEASTRAARATSTLVSIDELFDKATGIHPESTAHTSKSDVDDVLAVTKDVQLHKILTAIDHRDFLSSPLKALNRVNLEEWIKKKVKDHNKLHVPVDSISDFDEFDIGEFDIGDSL